MRQSKANYSQSCEDRHGYGESATWVDRPTLADTCPSVLIRRERELHPLRLHVLRGGLGGSSLENWRNDRIGSAERGVNPMVVARTPSGFVVIGDTQFLPGYCVLLASPKVGQLSDLPLGARGRFLLDMSLLGEAIERGSGFVSDGRHPGILLEVRTRIAAGSIVSDRYDSRA